MDPRVIQLLWQMVISVVMKLKRRESKLMDLKPLVSKASQEMAIKIPIQTLECRIKSGRMQSQIS